MTFLWECKKNIPNKLALKGRNPGLPPSFSAHVSGFPARAPTNARV
jgi:hypothetical protein